MMRLFLPVYTVLCVFLAFNETFAVEVSSPDGRLIFRIPTGGLSGETTTNPEDSNQVSPEIDSLAPYYRRFNGNDQISEFVLEYQKGNLLRGGFGLNTSLGNFWQSGQSIHSITRRSVRQSYIQPGHKLNPVLDHYNEALVEFSSDDSLPDFRASIRVRVYNDGAAFRYELHSTLFNKNSNSLQISEDLTWFRPVGSYTSWPMFLPGYDTSHEALYQKLADSQWSTYEIIATPLLMELKQGVFVSFTEASLRDFPGMYLKALPYKAGTRLIADLSRVEAKVNSLAKITIPFQSPWRVMMVGEHAGQLIESNLILNLNEPSRLKDDSWLRFGKTTWNWWNGFYQEPVDFKVGANFETIKHYIDFCADNGIDFHAIDCADDSWTWYEQSRSGFDPSDDADILKPRVELQFFRALAYAKFRGVGIRLWVHWKPLRNRLEEAMEEYAKWGIEGLMVDFLDRDDQTMIQWSEKVLQVAAKHQIRMQFHGAWKPTGLRRTYPNLVNHEGVLNLEYLKWSKLCTPSHNVTVPYTRMVSGPMDYHLGGFRSVKPEDFLARNDKPLVIGTRSHHLAMYVIYDNSVPMVSDAPTAYFNEPGFDFIKQVPTIWDEIRFLKGEVGGFIVIAKRKGTDWFLGAMSNEDQRTVEIPTYFLSENHYDMTIWSDVDSREPNQLIRRHDKIKKGDVIEITMVAGGGQVIHFTPLNN